MTKCFAGGRWPGLLFGLVAAIAAFSPALAAEPRPLNVLFLMTDQHHAAALGCAGNAIVKTPNLDRLAAGGARFANSYCAVPYCSPTRFAIVTGRYPSSLGVGRNIGRETDHDDPLRLREPCETYLHRLAARGYHCHQLGKWHVGDPAELSCFPEAEKDAQAVRRLMAERNKAAGKGRFDEGPRPGEAERIGNTYLTTVLSEAHRRAQEAKIWPAQDVGIIGRSAIKPEFSYESVLADYCVELLKRHRSEPFAITYSVSPPHAPCVAPSPFFEMVDPACLPLPATWGDCPAVWRNNASARMAAVYGETGLREWLRCYYAQVTMMDWCMGRILKALDDLGLADRTLVVFTSDHGTLLGQHGMMDKATGAFYDDLMRVPLLVRLPGRIPVGKACDATASSVDLAPTILDYLGAAPLSKVHGRSLRPFLEGASDDGRAVFGERGEPDKPSVARMIRTRQWKLCLQPRGRKELYDLEHDPNETRDLAGDPAMAPVIGKLSSQLVEHMRSIGDPALSRFAEPASPPANSKAGRRPNILILHADQHNARVLGCASHPDVKTPRLDRLAAEGVRFERAYCQDAICTPSRTSLMTGLYPRSTGVLWNGDQCAPGVRVEPLAAYLKRAGYRTGAFGRRHLWARAADTGWDVTCTTSLPKGDPTDTEFYYDWVRKIGQWDAFDRDMTGSTRSEMHSLVSQLTPDATQEAWAVRKASQFIRQSAREGKPFFCWVPYLHPHHPYTPVAQFYNLYDLQKLHLPASLHEPLEHLPPKLRQFRSGEKNPWCLGRAAKDENLFRRFLACYYGCVSQVDHSIGEILDALDETGQADNTIVIYTADHGDFAGYHGLVEKYPWGHNVYEETLRVPLIVRWPGHVRRSDVRQDLVEEVDLYPTLLGLIGIPLPEGYALPGRSLVATLTRGADHGRRFAVSENPYMLTVVGRRMKLGAWIESQKGNYPDMLFDLEKDPLEVDNLIGRPEAAAAEKELREQLAAWIQRTPNATGKPLKPLSIAGDKR